eukprot:UN33546
MVLMMTQRRIILCDKFFDETEATIICKDLGFVTYEDFQPGQKIPVGSDDVTLMFTCTFQAKTYSDCDSSEYIFCQSGVSLKCTNELIEQIPDVIEVGLKLSTDGNSGLILRNEKLLCGEMRNKNYVFGRHEASLVCQKLGFDGYDSYRIGEALPNDVLPLP